jgi:hypothetical protein
MFYRGQNTKLLKTTIVFHKKVKKIIGKYKKQANYALKDSKN